MKNLNVLNQYRIEHPFAGIGDEKNDAFVLQIQGRKFIVIASCGEGWEHVSVSSIKGKGCPHWEEMCAVKELFFEPEEVVVQYHPAESRKINNHKGCLHLWRPIGQEIPMPPEWMV